MSAPPTIERVNYENVDARQEVYLPLPGPNVDSPMPEERTQWRLFPRIPADAVERIDHHLRREPIVLAEREGGETKVMHSLPDWGLCIITADLNITPDAVAEALTTAVNEHTAAVAAADARLTERIAVLMRAYDALVQDWRTGASL